MTSSLRASACCMRSVRIFFQYHLTQARRPRRSARSRRRWPKFRAPFAALGFPTLAPHRPPVRTRRRATSVRVRAQPRASRRRHRRSSVLERASAGNWRSRSRRCKRHERQRRRRGHCLSDGKRNASGGRLLQQRRGRQRGRRQGRARDDRGRAADARNERRRRDGVIA